MYASADGMSSPQWGTVCDDYSWDIRDARVVCRQLGYPDALAAQSLAYYGQGAGPVLLDNIQCLGSESDIFMCAHSGAGNQYCFYYEDASVECLGNRQMLT